MLNSAVPISWLMPGACLKLTRREECKPGSLGERKERSVPTRHRTGRGNPPVHRVLQTASPCSGEPCAPELGWARASVLLRISRQPAAHQTFCCQPGAGPPLPRFLSRLLFCNLWSCLGVIRNWPPYLEVRDRQGKRKATPD